MQPYRLPQTMEERLRVRARRSGRTITAVAREAVLDEIDAIEDYYLAISLLRQQRRSAHEPPPSAR